MTVKIEVIEIFTKYNGGWKEVEFFGFEDIELINQMVWHIGNNSVIILEVTYKVSNCKIPTYCKIVEYSKI